MGENICNIAAADEFDRRVLDESQHRPVLVDFWAAWCAPCRMLAPVLEALVHAYASRLALVKVDVEAIPELATRFAIRGLPTVKIFRSGGIVAEFVGVQDEAAIHRLLEPYLPRPSDEERNEARRLAEQGATEAAATRLAAALEGDPDNYALALELVELHLALGDADAAQTLLERLPANVQQEPIARQLAAGAHFVRAAGQSDGASLDQRYARASRALLDGNREKALDELLAIMRIDRERGQQGLLAAFTLLGPQRELIERYRRRMAALLY